MVNPLLVTLLGAGGSYPPPGEYGPGILVDTGDYRIILDCGEGCTASLLENGYHPCSMDFVYISHYHIDHWSGLPSLGVARIAESCPSLTILAHRDCAEVFLEEARVFMPKSLELNVLDVEGSIEIGKYTLELFSVKHSVPTFGVRIIEDGAVLLSYTSDTRLDREVVEMVRSSKLLFSEATLPSKLSSIALKEGHMTTRDFLDLVKSARPGMAVAMHLSPSSLEELRRILPLTPWHIVVGRRGLQFTV